MSFEIPEAVRLAVRLLNENGFSAYPVGGCVRDLLLGKPPHDWDMCTSALPQEMHRVFAAYRLIDTGIKHGTVCVMIDKMPLEITTFRADGEYLDGRHPENVTFSPSLEEDLKRRDFTVNAMALDIQRDRIIDLFGGREDLKNGILRCVGDPHTRFTEDALRILRAVRFSARLHFTLDEATFSAMLDLKDRLSLISVERIQQEISGLLMAERNEATLLCCREILFTALPELRPMASCPQNTVWHDRDVWAHTALAVSNAGADLTLRWAVLLHDIGKPATKITDAKGTDHFPGHQQKGAELARTVLERMRLPNKMTDQICTLISYHDVQLSEENIYPLLARLQPESFFMLIDLKEADLSAHAPWSRERAADMALWRAQAQQLIDRGACLSLKMLKVNGQDLQALGIRGPAIGAALNRLLDAVTHEQVPNIKEALLSHTIRLIEKDGMDFSSRQSFAKGGVLQVR